MTQEVYLARAVKLAAKAQSTSRAVFKERFERMSRAYERLANEMRNNSEKEGLRPPR
jgi:hypothetical protein